MNKKSIWSKTAFGSLFLLLGTAFTACSNYDFQANLTSLNQLRTSANKDINLTQDKNTLIDALKTAFENNSEGTTKVLLDAWKFSLYDAKILEKQDPVKFVKAFGSGKSKEDIEPSAGVRGLRFVERFGDNTASLIKNAILLDQQKVEVFNIRFKSSRDFTIQIKLNAKGNYKKSEVEKYKSQIGVQDNELGDKEEGTLEADLIFTYTPPASNLFSKSNFDKLTKSINFNTNLKLEMVGKDEVMRKILNSSAFTNNLASVNYPNQAVNLLSYVLYSIL